MAENNGKKYNGVTLYDSTLRDGSQMSSVNFSKIDKYQILKTLVHELDIPYVEIYPFSNPTDSELIKYVTKNDPDLLDNLVAFGATKKVGIEPYDDPNLQTLVNCGLKTVCIFGKSWDFHLPFIRASPEENLKMIEESVSYLKDHGLRVFFDAEHFFDGYRSNRDYAIATLKAAKRGGAEVIVLCDTNGGFLPHDIDRITDDVLKSIDLPLGIHAHNDSGMAEANSLAVLKKCMDAGRSVQIQGTINGLGERTGNANLITLIPNLQLKMGIKLMPPEKLRNLTAVSNLVYELANLVPPINQPFVGYNAFSHKGGMHIAALNKDTRAYEHIDPESVGNKRRIVISEMSGRSAILKKLDKLGIHLTKDDPLVDEILKVIKRKESHGYTYEGADASLEILIKGILQDPKQAASYYRKYFFEVDYFRVITDVRNVFKEDRLEIITDANIKTLIREKDGIRSYHTAASGNGPVNALDRALRKALTHFYPVLEEIELIDYKVRIANALEGESGTASRVKVLVETRDKDGEVWGTIGSHVNIIVASFVALLDSYVYKLMKEGIEPYKGPIKIEEKIIEEL